MTHWCTTVSAAPRPEAFFVPSIVLRKSSWCAVFAVCCVVSCYRVWLHVMAGMILARLGAEMMKAMDAVWTRTLCGYKLCAACVCVCGCRLCRRMCVSVHV